MQVMPLVEIGLVNLFPDPWDFDYHLRTQTMRIAEERSSILRPMMEDDREMRILAEEELKRSLYQFSDENHRALIKQRKPKLTDKQIKEMIETIKQMREDDPFAMLQEGTALKGEDDGQLSVLKLAPNFEMAMYVAQSTGASIITDHSIRWKEILLTIHARGGYQIHHLTELANTIQEARFSILQQHNKILEWQLEGKTQPYNSVFRDAFRYLTRVDDKGVKPNYEKHLNAKFGKAHREYEATIREVNPIRCNANIQCAFPKRGIYDSTITRLLLMSSSEYHTQNVPMAFFLQSS